MSPSEVLGLIAVALLVMIFFEAYTICNHLRRIEKTLEVINESVYRKKYEDI